MVNTKIEQYFQVITKMIEQYNFYANIMKYIIVIEVHGKKKKIKISVVNVQQFGSQT